jgi:hypothetical protein
MAVIQLDIQPIGFSSHAKALFAQYMPEMGNRYGYALGYLSGETDKDPDEPFIYKGEATARSISCPLFEGYIPAICFTVEVLEKPEIEYSMRHHEMVNAIANRLAFVTMPDEVGQFFVLLVQSSPNNPEGYDEVVDMVYDTVKAKADLSGEYNQVMTTIVAFLTKGDTTFA